MSRGSHNKENLAPHSENLKLQDENLKLQDENLELQGANVKLQDYNGTSLSFSNLGQVDQYVLNMGVEVEESSKCLRAAIYQGHVKVTGLSSDLGLVIHRDVGPCGHIIVATLGDLFLQPDYAGQSYENNSDTATVVCKETCYGDEACWGRVYVTSLCVGGPRFDSGKSHNHCTVCPGFGQCIGDYTTIHCKDCDEHSFGFRCDCKGSDSDASFDGELYQYNKKLYQSLMPHLCLCRGCGDHYMSGPGGTGPGCDCDDSDE